MSGHRACALVEDIALFIYFVQQEHVKIKGQVMAENPKRFSQKVRLVPS